MNNCLFCRIIRGEIPSTKVYENDLVYAFRDINPQTPFHVLVVPKKHVASVSEIDQLGNDEIAACLLAVKQIAADAGALDVLVVATSSVKKSAWAARSSFPDGRSDGLIFFALIPYFSKKR